jgi:hypothetical protein
MNQGTQWALLIKKTPEKDIPPTTLPSTVKNIPETF